jgi:hypothetical protein
MAAIRNHFHIAALLESMNATAAILSAKARTSSWSDGSLEK